MKSLNLRKIFLKKENRALLDDITSLTGEPIAVLDSAENLILGNKPYVKDISFPIEFEGKTIGHVFGGQAAENLVKIVIRLIETWLMQRSLAEEILRKYKEHNLLHSINDEASLCPKPEAIASFIIHELEKIIKFDYVSILVFNEHTDKFDILASYGNNYQNAGYKNHIEKINAKVFDNGKGEIINEIFESDNNGKGYEGNFNDDGKNNTGYSFISVPLKSKEKIIGIINICSFNEIRYGTPDFEIISAVASYMTNSIETTRLYNAAYHDSLTGLPNRRLFEDYIEKAINRTDRNGKSMAVCFLDLDGFKSINDDYGHDAGDFVLVTVAERISGTLRKTDMLTRLGGDEFVLLLENLNAKKDINMVLSKIENAIIKEPINIDSDRYVFVHASIGVCLYPVVRQTASALLNNADKAMYLSKERKSDRICSWIIYEG